MRLRCWHVLVGSPGRSQEQKHISWNMFFGGISGKETRDQAMFWIGVQVMFG